MNSKQATVMKFSSMELARNDRFARWCNCIEGVPRLLGLRSLRRPLLPRASGQILEIGPNTPLGANKSSMILRNNREVDLLCFLVR
jgi:hypothetical protein